MTLFSRIPVKVWLTPEDIRQERKEPSPRNYRVIGWNSLRADMCPFKH